MSEKRVSNGFRGSDKINQITETDKDEECETKGKSGRYIVMTASTVNRGRKPKPKTKRQEPQPQPQQREEFPIDKNLRRIVPRKKEIEIDYNISFKEILEILYTSEKWKYRLRNWGTETIEFEGEIPPGGFVSFHKKGALSYVEIFRTTLVDIEKFYKGELDVLSLRPKVFCNLNQLLLIFDDDGMPLINPVNGKKIVFHDVDTPYGTIRGWQILYAKFYNSNPTWDEETQYSYLVKEYWKRSGAAQIQSWDDQGMGEDDENERIMMGGETPQGGVEKPDNLKLRQLMRELDPETAKKLADVFGVEVPDMSSLKDLVLDDMRLSGCNSYVEYVDLLAKEAGSGVHTNLIKILQRIDKGGVIGYDDDMNALFLLANNLRDPNGIPFDGNVKKLIDYAHQKAY